MDMLTLELLDVTAFQALVELRRMLEEHGAEALKVTGEDETVRHNVARFLDRQGRVHRRGPGAGGQWEILVDPGARPVAAPPPEPVHAFRPQALAPAEQAPAPASGPRPVLVLRSAFAPGDRALGRRLLLDTLAALEAAPWVLLAHQALELLEDPTAVEVLRDLEARGVPVRVSETSLRHLGGPSGGFEMAEDAEWQRLLGQGALTVL